MTATIGLRCLRCDAPYGPLDYARDCARCKQDAPSNLVVDYGESALIARPTRDTLKGSGLWRYGDLLPISQDEAISLGEGGSPLHHLTSIGRSLGVEALFAKDETRNPTASFKDRLACIAVSVARRSARRQSFQARPEMPVLRPQLTQRKPGCLASYSPRKMRLVRCLHR